MKKTVVYIVLIILPIVFLISGTRFERAKFAGDPEYIYLMNALNIVQGKAVGHIDNPGTTVMEFGALILVINHFFEFSSDDGLVTAVLKDPDKYVGLLQSAFVILNAIMFFLIGVFVFRKTKNIWYGLLFQLTPFFSVNLLEHAWTKVSPEPMLLFATTLLALVMVIYYYDQNRWSFCYVVWFSLISGFGLATKATYFPLLIIPIFILPGLKRKLLYIPGLIAGFVLFTSPAIPEYKNMFKWFYGLSTHTGVYGQGEKGFIDLEVYFSSIFSIFQNNPIFTTLIILSILTLLVVFFVPNLRKKCFKTLEYKILSTLAVAFIFGILLVAKHYHSNHYLLPELSLSGLSLYFILSTLKISVSAKLIDRYIIAIIVIVAIILLPIVHTPVFKQKNALYKSTNEEQNQILQMIEKDYPDHTRIYYYPGPLNKYSALKFGNVYTKKKNTVVIKEVYPQILFYDYRTNLFYNWEAETILEDIVRGLGHHILLIGGPREGWKITQMSDRGLPLKTVYNGRTQALHELNHTAMSLSDSLLYHPPEFEIICNMDTLSSDQTTLISGKHLYGKSDSRSDEKMRSGKYSVKLDKKRKFALDFNLGDLNPGDRYKISIWRYADNNDGHLVVSAKDSGLFYRSANDFIKTDAEGWRQISMYFGIPDNLSDNLLIIYVWNTGSSTIYFDDLTITKIK